MDVQAEVYYAGEPVGTLAWTPDAYGVQVQAGLRLPGQRRTRCCAAMPQAGIGQTLRVGLPEPQDGRLRLDTARLTRETLRAAGYADTPPARFYLAVQPEAECAGTGQRTAGRGKLCAARYSSRNPCRKPETKCWTRCSAAAGYRLGGTGMRSSCSARLRLTSRLRWRLPSYCAQWKTGVPCCDGQKKMQPQGLHPMHI